MSLRLIRPHVGQLLVVGFAGDRLPVELRALAREFGIGGIVLAPRNIVDVLQVADVARDAQSLSRDVPVWVARHPATRLVVPPLAGWPPLVTLGRADDEALTLAFARHHARQLLAVGFSLDFLPTLDLSCPATDPDGGDDTLASDAGLVGRHGARIVEGLQDAGLASCARHFPGIGGARRDAGLDVPLVESPPDDLDAVAWAPFRAAIAAGVSAMLVSHVLVPGLDETAPAPQSRRIVSDALRQRLAFTGAVFADDLDTLTSTSTDHGAHVAVQALRAGCDVIVQAGGNIDGLAGTLEEIVKAAERQDLPMARLENALQRHEAMKAAFLSNAARRHRPAWPTLDQMLASGEGERLAARMQEFL